MLIVLKIQKKQNDANADFLVMFREISSIRLKASEII